MKPGASNITSVLPVSQKERVEIEAWVPGEGPLHVLVLRLRDASGDAFNRWVVDGTAALLGELRLILGEVPQASVPYCAVPIVVWCPADLGAWERAAAAGACEAARGIVQSLTLEYGAALRCNLVLVDDATRAAVPDTLIFLASSRAGSVAGATFDLREAV
jgi:hypothetical protein